MTQIHLLFIGLVLFINSYALVSAQREVFVTCGLPTNGNGQPLSPFNNIQRAVTALDGGGGIITISDATSCSGNNIMISHTNLLIRGASPFVIVSCQQGQLAFIISDATVTIQNLDLDTCGNQNIDGGALFITRSFVTLNTDIFSDNVAKRGGGIFIQDSSLVLDGSFVQFFENMAHDANGGGAIYLLRTSITTRSPVLLTRNTANGQPNDVNCNQGSITGTPPLPPTSVVTCQNCYVQGLNGANQCPAA